MTYFFALPILVMSLSCFATDDPRTIYRAIGASPTDFVNAMKAPVTDLGEANVKSRLTKYFKFDHKTIGDSTIELHVQLRNEMLDAIATKYTSFDLKMTELALTKSTPRFQTQLTLSPSLSISGLLTVLPTTEGSLLKFEIQKASVPDWLLSRVLQVIGRFNFASASPTSSL